MDADTSGELVASYSSEFVVAIDKELVENRIFAALNFRYDPEWTHLLASDIWLQQSTLGISAAVTAQVVEGIFLGIETHYVCGNDGIGANVFLATPCLLVRQRTCGSRRVSRYRRP